MFLDVNSSLPHSFIGKLGEPKFHKVSGNRDRGVEAFVCPALPWAETVNPGRLKRLIRITEFHRHYPSRLRGSKPMICAKHSKYLTAFSLLLLVSPLGFSPAIAEAAPARPTVSAPRKLSLSFKAPRRGAPTSTAGGATRGTCMSGTQMPTPLTPKEGLGLTFSERPSFFVYVPQSQTQTAEFLLLSEDDTEIVYQTTFTLPATAGVIRFGMPADAPPLQTGKTYHWFITLNCDITKGPSGNPSAEGWVERVAVNQTLARTLAKTPISGRPAVYAEAGIWHETLMSLADLRRKAPNNSQLVTDWRDLLKSVGLDAIATQPLLDCCNSNAQVQ
ncbi:MAG: DUF928 domain-containing protein [Leptolyngbyaceae cyanobacterium HOT.MB2.61]|nr:DUF928 domain-containing protein [Leptolyngbyaceae cyanobacterium HOT.MB2.61]